MIFFTSNNENSIAESKKRYFLEVLVPAEFKLYNLLRLGPVSFAKSLCKAVFLKKAKPFQLLRIK